LEPHAMINTNPEILVIRKSLMFQPNVFVQKWIYFVVEIISTFIRKRCFEINLTTKNLRVWIFFNFVLCKIATGKIFVKIFA